MCRRCQLKVRLCLYDKLEGHRNQCCLLGGHYDCCCRRRCCANHTCVFCLIPPCGFWYHRQRCSNTHRCISLDYALEKRRLSDRAQELQKTHKAPTRQRIR
jgi:hypothetical protein